MSTIHTPARTPALHAEEAISFGGCDYLGLSKRPEIIEALRSHALDHGISSGASRTTTGNRPAHDALEQTITAFVRTEAAVLLPEGYLANLALCQALVRTHAIALIDERSHASLHDAARSAGMEIHTYAHMNTSAVRDLVSGLSDPVAVFSDGVFTSDGGVAPAGELLGSLRNQDLLVLDECHALGTMGQAGRGSCEYWDLDDPRIILTSTLAKGVGCYGGFVAGGEEIVARIRQHSSAYICTTPVPPALAVASERAIRVILDEPELVARLRTNSVRLGEGLCELGLVAPRSIPTPIVAFSLDPCESMERLDGQLRVLGFVVPLIRYPGGPRERYFRASVTAGHTLEQIDALIGTIGGEMG